MLQHAAAQEIFPRDRTCLVGCEANSESPLKIPSIVKRHVAILILPGIYSMSMDALRRCK